MSYAKSFVVFLLGKRDGEDGDVDDGLRQSLELLAERQQRSRGRFDLGKRLSSFRGDLGKRRRFDLGKRGVVYGVDAGVDPLTAAAVKRPFRGDLGKRRSSSFRGDLGKRDAATPYDAWMTLSDVGDDDDRHGRVDFIKRRYGFRGDLGKRRAASFRGDLGK